jgi:hypothetical protein
VAEIDELIAYLETLHQAGRWRTVRAESIF